jgi:hypothetical protein
LEGFRDNREGDRWLIPFESVFKRTEPDNSYERNRTKKKEALI